MNEKKTDMQVKIVAKFWNHPVFKFGFVFVAGVFLGFLLFSLFRVDMGYFQGDADKWKGTFVKPRSFEEMKVADALLFENQQVKATCNARYSADEVEIHLELSSDQLVTAILEINPAYFSVNNIQPIRVNDQSTTLIASNSVRILSIGENNYKIFLYNKQNHSEDIVLRLLQDDLQLYQNSITINK